jgi:hypothetical protein
MYIPTVNGFIDKIPKDMYVDDKKRNVYLWKKMYNLDIVSMISNQSTQNSCESKSSDVTKQRKKIYNDLGLMG